MAYDAEFGEWVREHFHALGRLEIKRMFGGAGVYSGDLFFAILAEDTLYLKVDEGNRAEYDALGIQPFAYVGRDGRTATMSYYPVPAEILDSPDALAPWARQALDAARRGAARQATKRRKPQGSGNP